MKAEKPELDELSRRLWQGGVAAFCPTTLSTPRWELRDTVARLGRWIRDRKPGDRENQGAIPLGIHLEGPFIAPGACGAHPPSHIRPFEMKELEILWEASHETLKILTVAPEALKAGQMAALVAWCEKRSVRLSLGHSQATEEQAEAAFEAGFRGVTHAWNALSFHHREPGALGAALGRKDVFVELILDGVHVSPRVTHWTQSLHPGRLCFVSDCAPAAGTTPGTWHGFGNLQIQYRNGACRLKEGHLAGGGVLLGVALEKWLAHDLNLDRRGSRAWVKEQLDAASSVPLRALGLSVAALQGRKIELRLPARGPAEIRALRTPGKPGR